MTPPSLVLKGLPSLPFMVPKPMWVDVKEETDTKEVPPCMILKSDGASLYNTTDLATIMDRMANYRPDRLIYLTDKRQDLYFEQVFRSQTVSIIALYFVSSSIRLFSDTFVASPTTVSVNFPPMYWRLALTCLVFPHRRGCEKQDGRPATYEGARLSGF